MTGIDAVARWRHEIALSWATLRLPERADRLSTVPLAWDLDRPAPRLAVDVDGRSHLLLATEHSRATRVESGVVSVSTRPLDIDEARGLFVDVECGRGDLRDLFTDVIAEIVTEIYSSPADAGGVVRR